MKVKTIKILLLSFIFFVLLSPQISSGNERLEDLEIPGEPQIPGRIEGTGTYFGIKDSDYLNITLKSSQEIKVILESIPKMISIGISPSGDSTSTLLTLSGLEPAKTYYKHQNSYKNEAVFISDENGNHSWAQDLTQSHHVWIQEKKGTIFLPDQCELYGTWDSATLTCTLNQDLTESVEIATDNITLDCNEHNITGNSTGFGIYLGERNNNIIKNCNINNFAIGICLRSSSNIISDSHIVLNSYGILIDPGYNTKIIHNQILNNFAGVLLWGSLNEISDNVVSNNVHTGVHMGGFSNVIKNNNISDNGEIGLSLWGEIVRDNKVYENTINSNDKNGIYLCYTRENNIFRNNLNFNGASGIYSWCSGQNNIFLNNFIDNQQNYSWGVWEGCGFAPDILNSPEKLNYKYHNQMFNNYLGNHWSDYSGVDTNDDGIGDIAYADGLDNYPLVEIIENYTIFEEPPPPEKWSFAIITDLHIGWGIPDYDADSYNDGAIGQEYYLTERLKKAVEWINKNYKNPDYNIKFVAVTGDISDTAEYSEFLTAREILNDLEIPYVPIIGNHDIWPYVQKPGDPDNRIFTFKDLWKGWQREKLGDEYFEEVFWQNNLDNLQKIENLLDSFIRQEELPGYEGVPYFQNYAFGYDGISFISLDFASRWFWELFTTPINSDLHRDSIDWLEEKLNEYKKEKVIIFTHYPFNIFGFSLDDILNLNTLIQNCDCRIFNFAGHTHRNNTSTSEYDAVETEAVSQIRLIPFYTLTGEFIRLVQITGDDIKNINYETLINGFPPAINPYFTVNPGEVSINQEITFRAYTKNLNPGDIRSYEWDFDGDGIFDVNSIYSYPSCKKTDKYYECKIKYQISGDYKITLKITSIKNPEYPEELSWVLKVKEEAKKPFQIFLPIPGLIPLLSGEDIDLTQIAQNTPEWAVITKIASAGKPIAGLLIHFEEVTADIDLSGLTADTDLIKRKSIIYMDSWPEVIEDSKILFVPSTGAGSVYLCPHATSLEGVNPLCKDIMVLNVGETKNGIILTTTVYNNQEYYLVFGVKGTGGGEFSNIEKAIKDLNDYIQNLSDIAFKNNPKQRKNTLQNKLEEVFVKIENSEYQDAINKLRNDIRAKADGSVGGNPKNDWIIGVESQEEICRMIDDLIAYL